MSGAYYNEIDPYAAQWLRNLIAAGHIAPGDVDERSIVDVQADDLKGFTQCHFFAGIGGWSLAARLAGFPDDRELWTGSCPCQPFSVAGKGEGQSDERHLWPVFFALISSRRPDVVMGEQVAAAVGKDWLDGVCVDLEGIGYSVGAAVVPACAVDAPHRRDRLWFVAHSSGEGWRQIGLHASGNIPQDQSWQGDRTGNGSAPLVNTNGSRREELRQGGVGGATLEAIQARVVPSGAGRRPHWADSEIQTGRRIEPSIRLLAHGVPGRVGQLRAYGNAIVPQVAAEVIGAYMEIAA